ncbi:MAG TPA: MBL fold metallo-hydrolase [Chloroflexota bacterium]|nr:MBL fold metallo-hydrolase [Chloroflexota bacterium]
MSTPPAAPQAEPVASQVYRIACPFGDDSIVQVYYVDAPQPALIDTGVKPSAAQVIEPALGAAGFTLQEVRHIFNTHGHWDHMGGNEAVRGRAPQARTYVPVEDTYLLGDAEEHLRGYYTLAARVLGGRPSAHQVELLRRAVDCPTPVDVPVVDGASFDLGAGRRLRAVHTPGHSRGSTSYLLEPGGVLFTGDGVQGLGSRPGQLPLVFDDSQAYRATLVKLSELAFEVVCLGHEFVGLAPNAHPIPGRSLAAPHPVHAPAGAPRSLDSGGGPNAGRDPVRRGEAARQFLEESGEVAKAVEEAMRSVLRTDGDSGFVPVARAALARLSGVLSLQLDDAGLNLRSLPTLHAFYRELTGALLPA